MYKDVCGLLDIRQCFVSLNQCGPMWVFIFLSFGQWHVFFIFGSLPQHIWILNETMILSFSCKDIWGRTRIQTNYTNFFTVHDSATVQCRSLGKQNLLKLTRWSHCLISNPMFWSLVPMQWKKRCRCPNTYRILCIYHINIKMRLNSFQSQLTLPLLS